MYMADEKTVTKTKVNVVMQSLFVSCFPLQAYVYMWKEVDLLN